MPLSEYQERLEKIGDQLRAKIASKFTASTFFAGFALTVLSGQVFALWQTQKLPALFPAAVGVLTAAVVLFVEAVLRLDELTMPKAFWSPTDAVQNPPFLYSDVLTDADLSNLHKRMLFLWSGLTIVAMFATGVAVLLMLIPFGTAGTNSIAYALAGLAIGTVYCKVLRAVAKRKFPELLTRVD